jgi:hypothetical protein
MRVRRGGWRSGAENSRGAIRPGKLEQVASTVNLDVVRMRELISELGGVFAFVHSGTAASRNPICPVRALGAVLGNIQ